MTPQELKSIREELGLSQEALATHMGITARMIRYMEAGKKPITRRTQTQLEMLQWKISSTTLSTS